MPPSTPVAPTPRALLDSSLCPGSQLAEWAPRGSSAQAGGSHCLVGTLGSYLVGPVSQPGALVAISHCVLAPREGWSPLGAQE